MSIRKQAGSRQTSRHTEDESFRWSQHVQRYRDLILILLALKPLKERTRFPEKSWNDEEGQNRQGNGRWVEKVNRSAHVDGAGAGHSGLIISVIRYKQVGLDITASGEDEDSE
jgi:hypothetical protein